VNSIDTAKVSAAGEERVEEKLEDWEINVRKYREV
jgi:hypothetical protein